MAEEGRKGLGKGRRERKTETEKQRQTAMETESETQRESKLCHSAKPPSFGSIELKIIICNFSSQGIHRPRLASAGTRWTCGTHICMQEKHT